MTEENATEIELRGILKGLEKKYCFDDKVRIELKYWNLPYGSAADVDTTNYTKSRFIINCYGTINNFDKEMVLRHELVHIKDIINPGFKYDREYLSSGTCDDKNLEIGIVQLLWDISIVLYLNKEGFIDTNSIEKRIEEFKIAPLKTRPILPEIIAFCKKLKLSLELGKIEELRNKDTLSLDIIRKMAGDKVKERLHAT